MVYHPNIDLEGNVCLNILRWATIASRVATATSGVATAGSGSPSVPVHLAGWDKGANGCPVHLECGHGAAMVTWRWPRPPLWWPRCPPADAWLVPREDWKPVLTINSIIYGLQYLFLVSTAGGHVPLGGGHPVWLWATC